MMVRRVQLNSWLNLNLVDYSLLIIIRFVILIFMFIHLTATDLYISYGDW